MEWNEYLTTLLQENTFEGISISIDDGEIISDIPPFIRASVLLLDKMLANMGNKQIIVFPERVQSEFIFVLSLLFYSIIKGKVKKTYDPSKFLTGDKLKLGNAVVEYMGTEIRDNKECIILKMSDLAKYSVPIDILPMLQKTDTKRPLSTNKMFAKAKNEVEKSLHLAEVIGNPIASLSEYRTHMVNSILNMTSVAAAKEQVSNCRIFGKRITDLLLLASADYEGNIQSIGAGQLSGIPAVIFTPDLYSLSAVIEKKAHPLMLILDISNLNAFLNQLDALDELLRLDVPTICITDTVNSMNLQQLTLRGFNIWRWDSFSITDDLYVKNKLPFERKVEYCAKQEMEYINVSCCEVNNSVKKLMAHRHETQDQSAQMMKIYNKLYGLSFKALHTINPLLSLDCEIANNSLDSCKEFLMKEKPYLLEKTFQDYLSIIDNLKIVYSEGYQFPKHSVLMGILRENLHSNICIIVPDNTDKNQIQQYWKKWPLCVRNRINISIVWPSEYYGISCTEYDITIIVGWLKRAIMKKIIFSYNTQKYIVLLYDYENRWKNYDSKIWSAALSHSDNKTIINESFNKGSISISTINYGDIKMLNGGNDTIEDTPEIDEIEEVELILSNNRYNQYVSRGRAGREIVEAIPVSFVGSYIAFYRYSHNLISATKLIMNKTDKIDTILPEDLKTGDFIVVRESDKDIIKDMADLLLKNSNKSDLRKLATKWKEVLDIELLFSTAEELYERLVAIGCQKGPATIKRWIEDDDIIAPIQKEDLKYIAEVTQSDVLNEMLDSIYDAAQEVKSAHIQAGRKLSQQLRAKLTDELKKYGVIDPFNLWEPIEMDVEGIGGIKILKVIDIGSAVNVNSSDTNRLIEE